MGFENRFQRRLAALAVGSAATVYFGSPVFALADCGLALAQGNAEKLGSYIDFPALQASLKEEVRQIALNRFSAQQAPGANPLLGLAILVMAPVLDAAVGTLATPAGLKAWMGQQAKPSSNAPKGSLEDRRRSPLDRVHLLTKARMGYRSLNTFVVSSRDKKARPLQFTLARQGFASWKLVAIDLPPDGTFTP